MCPSSQGGLGEEGALVGTTTPSRPSPPRGSGAQHLLHIQDILTLEHSEQAFIEKDIAIQSNPREDLKSKFTSWGSSGQTKPNSPPNPRTKSDEPEAVNFPFKNFIENLNNKKKQVLSGRLFKEIQQNSKITPTLNINLEPDPDDNYWEMAVDNLGELMFLQMKS